MQGAHPSSFPQKLYNKGVNEFGILWADADTIYCYYCSYLEHIYKLHPFLDQGDLDKEIKIFIKFYCLPKTSGLMPTGTGTKRKRSYKSLQGAASNFLATTSVRTEVMGCRIKKLINNTILLLVLALGSIYEVGDPVPGPVTDNPLDFYKEWIPSPPTLGEVSGQCHQAEICLLINISEMLMLFWVYLIMYMLRRSLEAFKGLIVYFIFKQLCLQGFMLAN
ncbi:hypothetical protein IFM47457_11252 [Aspergillus lentulus]|nr:hypothetical protein IFM47457_11252 [Aspergillus lentulus]